MSVAARSAHIGCMEKILSQHRWDRLPVNTFARLYQYVDGKELIMHVVRVAGPGRQQLGDAALLGETEWRDAFNEADVAFALHIPAVENLSIGDVYRSLRKLTPWAEVEIACGTHRYMPLSLEAGEDGAAVLGMQPMNYTGRPVTTRTLTERLSVLDVRDPEGAVHPVTATDRLTVVLDGVALAVTEVRQEGESAIIIARALDVPAPETGNKS